jgi:probable HAF family extracellular repeat protein
MSTLNYRFLALVLTLTVLAAAPARVHAAVRYTVVDLGTLGGGFGYGSTLNGKGHLAGQSVPAAGTATGTPAAGVRVQHCFLSHDGTMTDLGTLGGPSSICSGINDADQVAGGADTADGNRHAFLWDAGTMTDLGTLGGDDSWAVNVNNRGQVVGFSTTLPGQQLEQPGTHAFLWENGKMTDLGTLGGDYSRANGINDAGQVVGAADTAEGAVHPFLWDHGMMIDLGLLPGFNGGRAIRINAKGQVAGFGQDPIGTPTATSKVPVRHAFLWENGKLTDLGLLGGLSSLAFAVNNRGQVVGWADVAAPVGATPVASAAGIPATTHGFIWENGTMTDLNGLIPTDGGWVIDTVWNINDEGQIAGSGQISGETHAVLLTPNG